MSQPAKPKVQGPAGQHSGERMTAAAQAAGCFAAGIDKPADTSAQPETLNDKCKAAMASVRHDPPITSCKVAVKIALFFDGTGNNLDADLPTQEHSNVARLYRAHPIDDVPLGLHRRYIPGLGTYFKDIGDPGDWQGMAFGKRGEQRLVWAMEQVDAILAKYPPRNIEIVRLALFGFSRGAALARAFARRLQARCERHKGAWRWTALGCGVELYFVGLFDTVASVGLPASSNTPLLTTRIGKRWVPLDHGLTRRRLDIDIGVGPVDGNGAMRLGLAFGRDPGADPTPGPLDGHQAWASDLRLPPMTQQCVHYIAAHEVRNSFPLDSLREGGHLPAGIAVDERVYPGVHSDVGGGYRPGEGGKSLMRDDQISLMPLNEMLKQARAAGVPLTQPVEDDFTMSARMLKRWHAYMAHPTLAGNRSVEAWLLAHLRLYYAWRLHAIRRNLRLGGRPDANALAALEAGYREEAAALQREITVAEQDPQRLAALAEREQAEQEFNAAHRQMMGMNSRGMSAAAHAATLRRLDAARRRKAAADQRYAEANDARMRLVARNETLPGGGLAQITDVYDRHLVQDVLAIKERLERFNGAVLRPHYVRLIEAWDAETESRGLLSDHPLALEFFDHHVHDSLAGFAMDATLPSDPRVVYVGRDEKAKHPAQADEPARARAGAA